MKLGLAIMLHTAVLKRAGIAVFLAIVVTGCSDNNASFSISEKTRSLIPEAQAGIAESPGVVTLLDQKFGTPQTLKAWMKLPVQWGGAAAKVEVFAADGGEAKVKFTAEEGQTFPEKAGFVNVVTGAGAGKTFSVSSWDAATGEAVLTGLDGGSLAAGDICSIDGGSTIQSGRVLYMRHCSHCHGTAGDGNGPTAQYLYPRPRDYRHGVFKFTSTNDMSKVSRDDLLRVLRYGIPGTYMPSFLLMKDEELTAIVEYVRFLSMRGEFERKLVNELASDFSEDAVESRLKDEQRSDIVGELAKFLAEDLPGVVDGIGAELEETWVAADTEDARIIPSVPRVPDSEESRRRGRELYLSKTLNCADCHGIDGAGNGPQTMVYEKNPVTNVPYNEPGLHDVWDNLNQPRNLHTGIFRGGRRPIDLFCRIHAGIKGSRMPSFKNTPHEDIWHIVNYVLSIPFESEPGATGVAAAPAAAPDAAAAPAAGE
jgi:mono/diheme cytochrome c family protein